MTKTYRPVNSSQLADELNQAFASADPHIICRSIGEALKDFNISVIAKKTGLQRTSIHRAFGTEQLPNFSTVLAVLTAMNLELKVAPKLIANKRTPVQANSSA